MDLQTRFEANQTKLQALANMFNELGDQRNNIMEQITKLNGQQQLLTEMLKEATDGPGRTTAKVGKGDAAS